MPRSRASLALFYFVFIGALGLFLPYFSLWLAAQGLAPTEISLILAISPLMGLAAPPLVGLLADTLRARGWLLRFLTTGTALAFCGFLHAGGLVWFAAVAATFAFLRAPIWALVDSAALEHVRKHGGSYGRLRLWGSLGFVLAALVGGSILDRFGIDAICLTTIAVLGLAAAVAWSMPASPPETHREVVGTWLAMLRERDLWLLLGAVAAGQAAAASYDAYFSLHLVQHLGYTPSFVGIAFAVGVIAEVVMLALSGRVIPRLGYERALAIAFATAAARWLLLSFAHSPVAVLALAPLHAITFVFYYVAAVQLIRERAKPEVATAAQGLLSAASAFGSAIGMFVWGQLFDRAGGPAMYRGASAVAVVACVTAIGYARRRRLGLV
jgi:PPP family 3-phenylpropionic acid transporter